MVVNFIIVIFGIGKLFLGIPDVSFLKILVMQKKQTNFIYLYLT
jgi:hypothetical protein